MMSIKCDICKANILQECMNNVKFNVLRIKFRNLPEVNDVCEECLSALDAFVANTIEEWDKFNGRE